MLRLRIPALAHMGLLLPDAVRCWEHQNMSKMLFLFSQGSWLSETDTQSKMGKMELGQNGG